MILELRNNSFKFLISFNGLQTLAFYVIYAALGEASTDSPTETSTVRLSSSPSTTASDPSIIFDPIQPRNTQAITAAIADKLSEKM